jgi:hypothetical protein
VIREHPPSTQKMSTAGSLRGNARDPGAPNINAKNVDDGPQALVRGVINLHGYDRQKVILLTGPTSLRLVLLWLTILGRLMGHG